MSDPAVLLEARNLALFTPTGSPLFQAEGFVLGGGDCLHIHGENGSGKSSAVMAFLGRYHFYSGEIDRHYAPERVAYLPQMGNTQHLIPLSLGDVIRMTVEVSDDDIAAIGLLKAEDLARPWNTSSGGERQKALLTQTFASDAQLIILDEPFNHLDSKGRELTRQLIAARRELGTAMIIVSHLELGLNPSHLLPTSPTDEVTP